MQGSGGVVLRTPVGHDKALVAPLTAQNIGDKVTATAGVRAVELVVTRHQGKRFTLFHGNLKAAQVDFAQSALRHILIDAKAVILLVVAAEVLDRRTYAGLGLHTAHIGGGHFAGDEQVLGVIFKVAATQRIAVDFHGRGQQQRDAELDQLVGHSRADFLQQRRVPALGQQHFHRPGGGVAVDVLALAAAQPRGKLAQHASVVALNQSLSA
jgi:hypothetical protein